MGSTVALIGGSGFIGQTLISHLDRRGYSVRILDIARPPRERPGVDYRCADVTSLPQIVEHIAGCDGIINLAAAHRDDVRPVSLYHDVNVLGAQNVCLAAERHGIRRMVFTSSVAIYGFQDGVSDENTPPNPFNHYGRTKLEAEGVYRAWQQRNNDRRLAIVRPTVVFGPRNRGNVYNLFRQLASGHFVMVGNGENRKSMAYVENVAAFLAHMTDYGANQGGMLIYNYADKNDYSMNELLATVRAALGRRQTVELRLPYWLGLLAGSMFDLVSATFGHTFSISRIRVQKFCANTVFSAEKLGETGFVAPFKLEDAVLNTVKCEFGAGRGP